MKLSLKSIIIGLFFISQSIAASDYSKIYNKMYDEYLSNPSKFAVAKLLEKMTPVGAFYDVNYQTTEGEPRQHLQNMTLLAAAYENPDNLYYYKDEVKDAYLKALKFWIDFNHQPANWWYRYIAYPKELSRSVILMSTEIKKDKPLFNKTMEYLQWSYDSADKSHLTGANGADIIIGSLAASVLTENDIQLMIYKNKMSELLTIQPVEGIQPDYLFAQHCGTGRQLYFANYGKEYVNSMLYYLEFTNSTKYETRGADLLQDLFVNGVQWIFYNKNYDPNNSGRFDNSDIYFDRIKELSERLFKLNISDKSAMKDATKHISGGNGLEGNRMFWRFDYMIHRRKDFMTSSRMTSTRTVGNEAGNGDGERNYYASNGVNYIFVTGKEYDRNYFKKFNNRQFPGITAEQDNDKLPIPEWGKDGNNGNDFAGGVTDSINGACGMILDRRGLNAHKAWFYFDEEFVCLGAGINENNGKADIYTTVNQTNYDGKVIYSVKGKTETLQTGKAQLKSPEWIISGNACYFNLESNAEYSVAVDTALFSLNINHGVNPQDKSYAYLVKPDMSKANDADKYSQNIPVKILSNTKAIQAVQYNKPNLIEVIFYQAGTLKLDNGNIITVDEPCALMVNQAKSEISIANPRCESVNPTTIKVSFTLMNKTSEMTFQMPEGDRAGSSQTKKYKI